MIILIYRHIITPALTFCVSSSSNSNLNKRFFAIILNAIFSRYMNPKKPFTFMLHFIRFIIFVAHALSSSLAIFTLVNFLVNGVE